MDPPTQSLIPPSDHSTPHERNGWSASAKTAFFYTGLLLPMICFAIGFPESPDWQSGDFEDYVQLMMRHKATLPWYPILFYNMFCMHRMIFAPERNRQRFWVRWGIYSGVLVALQYWVLFMLALSGTGFGLIEILLASGFGALVTWGIAYVIVLMARKSKDSYFAAMGILLAFFLMMIALIVVIGEGVFLLTPFLATPWAVLAYSVMSIHLLKLGKRWQFSLASLFMVITWFGIYMSAWRFSYQLTLIEYAKLPTEPPLSCYVATAAANGHRHRVGSTLIRLADGSTLCVNSQLRTLKAGELILQAIAPRFHRVVRCLYDRIGPPLARQLTTPFRADLAYLLLKPAEWTVRLTLTCLMSQSGPLIDRLYQGVCPMDSFGDGIEPQIDTGKNKKQTRTAHSPNNHQ